MRESFNIVKEHFDDFFTMKQMVLLNNKSAQFFKLYVEGNLLLIIVP